VGVMQHKEVLV